MKRRKHSDFGGIVAKVLGTAAAVGGAVLVATQLPTLVRYLKMKRMATSEEGASPDLLPPPGSPTYAQAPRRAVHARP